MPKTRRALCPTIQPSTSPAGNLRTSTTSPATSIRARLHLPKLCRCRSLCPTRPTRSSSGVLPSRRAWAGPEPRLLVFDNCKDPALLKEWRPTGGGARAADIAARRSRWICCDELRPTRRRRSGQATDDEGVTTDAFGIWVAPKACAPDVWMQRHHFGVQGQCPGRGLLGVATHP